MKSLKKNDLKTKESSKITIYAAALQDHYLKRKDLNLLSFGLNKPKEKFTSVGLQPLSHQSKALPKIGVLKKPSEPSTIKELSNMTTNQDKLFLDEYKKQQKATKAQERQANAMKLHNYMKKLTLAQRLGLVEKPPKPLSDEDWKKIEEIGKNRITSECPICLEEFKIPNSEVVLSCSHVFHKHCLANFEKFSKTKACPICRRSDYEKKNFDHGFVLYLNKSAIKIQKNYRGYITRKKIYTALSGTYKATSTLFRRRLLGYKLRTLSEKMEKRIKQKQTETNKLLSEIDQNLEKNNELIHKLRDAEYVHRINRANYENIETMILTQNGVLERVVHTHHHHVHHEDELHQSEEWKKIYNTAKARNENTCAICFNTLNNDKKLTLLNCSHIFHENCLTAFEYYDLSNSHSCPVCRHKYTRIPIKYWE